LEKQVLDKIAEQNIGREKEKKDKIRVKIKSRLETLELVSYMLINLSYVLINLIIKRCVRRGIEHAFHGIGFLKNIWTMLIIRRVLVDFGVCNTVKSRSLGK